MAQNWLTGPWGMLDFKCVIFKSIVVIILKSISSVTAFKWMVQDPTDDKSILVQVKAWCRQATTHNLNQCWLLRSMMAMLSLGHDELKFVQKVQKLSYFSNIHVHGKVNDCTVYESDKGVLWSAELWQCQGADRRTLMAPTTTIPFSPRGRG